MKHSLRQTNAGMKRANAGKRISPSVFTIDEGQQEYVVYVTAPGMQRKDLSICINKKQLTVSAAKEQALHCLMNMGKNNLSHWSDTFTLPADADTLITAAEYRNGELQIHIPKGNTPPIDKLIEVFVY